VIGAGTAGLISAAGSAGLGAKVALIERHLMGGDCLNVGCVPSKGVIRASRAWQDAREARERFGGPVIAGDAQGDFGAAMARMRRLRAGISIHDSARRYQSLGIDVFLGQGHFVSPDTVEIDGKRLRFRRAVIATGARAAEPRIPGLAAAGFRTNETIFNLTELPKRLVVLGGGPIGCEMSQAFARFGSQVTHLNQEAHILPREDADAAEIVQQAMIRDGVHFEFNMKCVEVRRQGGEKVVVFERGGLRHEVVADEILVATGRAPNIEGLGLEAAGVRHGKRGVEVDDHLRTSNKAIFACDVASRFQFTHVADAQARIVIQNALFFGRSKASALTIPWCTYTTPEIAHVGLYEKDAKEKGIEVDTVTVPLSTVDRAILDGADEGFLRVHVQKGSKEGKIAGATLVAEHAGDMLGELCLAVTHGIGLKRIASVIHPYPTQGEAVKKAADQWRRGALTPTVKKVFGTWFKVFK